MSKKSTVTMNFVSVGSASGQQQPQQQQQQAVFQQQQVQQQQRQQAQQQSRQRPRPQPQIEVSSSEEEYIRSLHTTMSMRAPRAGDMFHNEMKMEKRYDEEEQRGTPTRLMVWFRDFASQQQQQGPPIPQPNGADFKSIHAYLCDGVVLCRVMNRLLKVDGKPPVPYRRPKSSNMAINKIVWRSNVESFLIGAKQYGVPTESLFEPTDLVEGRKAQGLCVINCLNALACVGNAKGGCPTYEEPKAPIADYAKDECYD